MCPETCFETKGFKKRSTVRYTSQNIGPNRPSVSYQFSEDRNLSRHPSLGLRRSIIDPPTCVYLSEEIWSQ